MRYKEKGDQKLARELIAQELTILAGIIADGDVGTLDNEIALEDQGRIRWENRVKDGRFIAEFKIEIPLATEVEDLETRFSAGPPEADEDEGEEDAGRGRTKTGRDQRRAKEANKGHTGKKRRRKRGPKGKNGGKNSRPYRAKKIKKAMGGLWKELSKAVKSGDRFPPDSSVKLFDLINQYRQLADPEWKEQWEECARAVKDAVSALKAGRIEDASAAIDRANRLTKACHKQYK
jgi:XXXCH domain-containing protein